MNGTQIWRRGPMRVALWSGAFVASVGLLTLVGWAFEAAWLENLALGATSAKANTAIGLFLAGLSLSLLSAQTSRWATRFAQALAVAVCLLGTATAAEHALDLDLGIDQFFLRDNSAEPLGHRGRMEPHTALLMTLAGIGLATLPAGRTQRVSRLAAWLVLTSTAVTLLFRLWETAQPPLGDAPSLPLAAAVGFLLLGLGMLLSKAGATISSVSPTGSFSSVESKALTGFAGTLLLLLLAGGNSYQTQRDVQETSSWVSHTLRVRAKVQHVHAAISEAEAQQRNYLLSGQSGYMGEVLGHIRDAELKALELALLVADNPTQLRNARRLKEMVDARAASLHRTIATYERQGLPAAQEAIRSGQGREWMEAIRDMVQQMDSTEARLLDSRIAGAASSRAKSLVSLVLTLAVAAAGFAFQFHGMRRELRQRNAAEEALRRGEANLAVTLHSIGDGVLATDTRGRITRLNSAAQRLTGWTEADGVGRPVEEVFRIVNEATRLPSDIPVAETLATGAIHGLAHHTLLIARDSTERPIADSCAPIKDQSGAVIGAVLVFRDVSGERAAEEQLRRSRAIFENLFIALPGHFLVLDPDLKIVSASDAYLAATMTRRDGITGRSVFEVFPDNPEDSTLDGSSRLRRSLEKVLETGRPDTMAILRYDIRRPDGVFEERFWSPTNSPVLGADSRVEYIIHRAEDVTEFIRQKSRPLPETPEVRARMDRSEAEVFQSAQKLQAAKQQLEAANKELEAFSYSISHDLRAPLRHIHGYVQMLAKTTDGLLPPKAARYLKVIQDASTEMGQLIDDLLSFSRMGRAEIRQHAIDLNQLVGDTIRGLELQTKDRSIEWRIEPLPPARGDAAMLRQVFSNLIGNAVKYTRQRDPAVIQIGRLGDEDGSPVLFIRDNGAGFDMGYAHKLFGVFQRLHRAEEFEGTGIGLATVHRILNRHGSRIWAEAEPGKGATFYFTIKPEPNPNPLPTLQP